MAPSPIKISVAPSPTKNSVAPSPTKISMAPSPTKSSVVPSPTKSSVAPSPTKISMAPSPTKISMAPSPTKSSVAPSPTKISMVPSPTKISVVPSPTKISVVPSPTKNLAHNKHFTVNLLLALLYLGNCFQLCTFSCAIWLASDTLSFQIPHPRLFTASVHAPFPSSAPLCAMTPFLSEKKPSLDSLKSNLKTFLFPKQVLPDFPLHAAIFLHHRCLFKLVVNCVMCIYDMFVCGCLCARVCT